MDKPMGHSLNAWSRTRVNQQVDDAQEAETYTNI